MVRLRIDNMEVRVPEGTTLMHAANELGIDIPSMCFMEGYTNHPSCMVCLVKEKSKGQLLASCAVPVAEGMEVVTNDDEVKEARREALELLLSDHVGDCEAPCRMGCPAFMNIPLMNRLIAAGKFREALVTVKEEIALPLVLGYICEAPCEKVCRRVPIDGAVSICQLKRIVAAKDLNEETPFFPRKEKNTGKKVAVIGAGPAGLSAAFYLTRYGFACDVFDRNHDAGGSLRNVPENILPGEALEKEMRYLKEFGVRFHLETKVDAAFFKSEIRAGYDAVILATGELIGDENKKLGVEFDSKGFTVEKRSWQTGTPGVFACGSAVRKQQMAIRAVAQGKETADAVRTYLVGTEPEKGRDRFNSKFGKLLPEEHAEYLKESVARERIEPAGGKLAGYLDEEAVAEAERCMRCDCRKPESCKLRIYADDYGADRKKYLSGERKSVRKQHTHESIVYEQEKCIKCGLCVEIAAEEKELTGLTYIGRGFDVRIGIPFTRDLEAALARTAEKCALACPTAAISMKNNDE